MSGRPGVRAVVSREGPAGAIGVIGAAVVVAVAMLLVLPSARWSVWAVAVVLAAALAWVCWTAPRVGVVVVLGWLFVLGGARRVVAWQLVDVAKDPLLLVGPAGLAVLTLHAARRGAFRGLTLLAGLVAALSVVCVAGVLNPRQDGLLVGLAGLLFWLVPMVWFWVGRALVDDRLFDRVILVVALAGLVSAVVGLTQEVAGFPPWDLQWIRERGYAALYVGGPHAARSFGLAASAVEFALIVALGAFVFGLFAARNVRRRDLRCVVVDGGALLLCGAALVVSGVRTAIVMLALAVAACVLVRLRPSVGVLVGLAALVVAGYAALWLVPADQWSQDGAAGSVRRIVLGLRNPFDRDDSTLLGHVDLVERGLRDGIDRPLGSGTGSTNLAGERFSDSAVDTEFDVSNGAVAFGVVGIVLTSAILAVGMATAFVAAWRVPDRRRLAVLGVLLLSFRFWWNGGHYFVSAVLWVGLGWLDATRRPARRASSTRAPGRA